MYVPSQVVCELDTQIYFGSNVLTCSELLSCTVHQQFNYKERAGCTNSASAEQTIFPGTFTPDDCSKKAVGKVGFVIDNGDNTNGAGRCQVYGKTYVLSPSPGGSWNYYEITRPTIVINPTEGQCREVLKHFHSACDPSEEACHQANQQSFQIGTRKVCDSVHTRVKFKFESIGDEFDGFVDSPTQGKFSILMATWVMSVF
jgi:hypothetical protein